MDSKTASNATAMLMQTQERKHLVNKLILLKGHVDQREPRQYTHLNTGPANKRNNEVRKINVENQQMLKKIMNIMHRKPTDNGLKGVPIKRQTSTDHLSTSGPMIESYTAANADIRLIEANVDMIDNRFNFEIMSGKNRGPFQQKLTSGDLRTGANTEHMPPLIEHIKFQGGEKGANADLDLPGLAHTGEKQVEETESSAAIISNIQSQENYKNLHSSLMFDKNIPVSDSEMVFYPQNEMGQDQRALTQPLLSKPLQ